MNCDAVVEDHFCPKCGQENIEPKQSLWHLLLHFFNDVTHFDGKLFVTMKDLVFRPGFLSAEYVKGRRVKYLDPVRMYLFISTIFAIVFISNHHGGNAYISPYEHPDYARIVDSVRKADDAKHSSIIEGFGFNSNKIGGYQVNLLRVPSEWKIPHEIYKQKQKALPDSLKDNWIENYLQGRGYKTYEAYNSDPYNFFPKFSENLFHSLSKIFFFSLPLFVLTLSILFVRRRKEYNVVSNAIFSLHCYSMAFIVFTLFFACDLVFRLNDDIVNRIFYYLVGGLLIYLYVAMLRFYKQGWLKTLTKFLLLSATTFIIVILLTISILVNSLFTLGVH